MKKCTKCGDTKPFSEFYKRSALSDGHASQCKLCCCLHKKLYYKEHSQVIIEKRRAYVYNNKDLLKKTDNNYYAKNRTKILAKKVEYHKSHSQQKMEYDKKYRIENAEKIAAKNKRWKERNRDKIRERSRNKMLHKLKTDPNFKLLSLFRDRIRKAIKNQYGTKAYRTMELLGCTIEQARTHLESQFYDGMTWQNQGDWHIDHIKPCSSFNLTDTQQQLECFHYTNLQPLWAEDNLKKSDKFV